MFSKSEQEASSFSSCWKTEKLVSENGSQTQAVDTREKESQVILKSEVSCQTAKEEPQIFSSTEHNDFKILSFLQRIAPKVEEELQRSSRSRAFDGYSLLNENSDLSASHMHTLRCPSVPAEHAVIDISWSCTGSVVAVGYGVPVHDDWCSHRSVIAIWNINRKDFVPAAPEQVIEVGTCVTCLSFHPRTPALLAVGNMAGEVMVYDLAQSSDAVPLFRGDSGGLNISMLVWRTSEDFEHLSTTSTSSSVQVLVSLTSEGIVLFWAIRHDKEMMSLRAGFLVSDEDIPRGSRPRTSDSLGVRLTGISFASDDKSRFLLGTQGGSILLCSTRLMEKSDKNVNGVVLNKCVESILASHEGPVLHVSLSSFHPHAVLSLGSDKSLRIYSLLQPNNPVKDLLSEDMLTCAEWLPSRPLVVAAGKASGGVVLYSFMEKDPKSLLELPQLDRPSPLSVLAFSENNLKLLACGDHLGRVSIWQLPESVLSATAYELTVLGELVQISRDK